MHLQVFPRTAAAASTAAETQEDEGESSGQEYESATDTEEVEGEEGEGEGDGEEGDLGDAPLPELMCMEQSECDQVWIYNYSLASLCLTYHSLVIRALSADC